MVQFYKYQATGNDFVIIDNRDNGRSFTKDEVQAICDRKFGIGADGLMLIENHAELDFNLVYYNSDGSQSLCGNGSRAAVTFASKLGIVDGNATFNAYDGPHEAEVLKEGVVRLKMKDVALVERQGDDLIINTGSPHFIRFVKGVREFPVFDEGRKIRYGVQFGPSGTNANFVELEHDNTIFVRTYERGVENETLSCGTGVTAAALAARFHGYSSPVKIKTLGGELQVEFDYNDRTPTKPLFSSVHLIGPAKMVFKGELEL